MISEEDRIRIIKDSIKSEEGWKALVLAIHNKPEMIKYCLDLFDTFAENKDMGDKIKQQLITRLEILNNEPSRDI